MCITIETFMDDLREGEETFQFAFDSAVVIPDIGGFFLSQVIFNPMEIEITILDVGGCYQLILTSDILNNKLCEFQS